MLRWCPNSTNSLVLHKITISLKTRSGSNTRKNHLKISNGSRTDKKTGQRVNY